jgi:phage FluMu protein Com
MSLLPPWAFEKFTKHDLSSWWHEMQGVETKNAGLYWIIDMDTCKNVYSGCSWAHPMGDRKKIHFSEANRLSHSEKKLYRGFKDSFVFLPIVHFPVTTDGFPPIVIGSLELFCTLYFHDDESLNDSPGGLLNKYRSGPKSLEEKAKISLGIKTYIKENPEARKLNMDKIILSNATREVTTESKKKMSIGTSLGKQKYVPPPCPKCKSVADMKRKGTGKGIRATHGRYYCKSCKVDIYIEQSREVLKK